MRYIAENGDYGRILYVSFGADIECDSQTCHSLSASAMLPGGYTSLEAWYVDNVDKLHLWEVTTAGDLVKIASPVTPVADKTDFLPLTGGTLTGSLTLNSGFLNFTKSGEQDIVFDKASSSAWKAVIYKGGTTSSTVLGLYDSTNSRSVWAYNTSGNFVLYRPTSFNGNATVPEDKYLYFGTGHIIQDADGSLKIAASSDATRRLFLGKSSDVWTLCPAAGSGNLGLGTSSVKWGQIYSTNSSISTSDRNEKNTIASMDREFWRLFTMGLIPVTYKLNDGTSDRTHTGLIAQDVEELMKALGMDSKDFAGFIKYHKERLETYTETVVEKVEKIVEKVIVDDTGKEITVEVIEEGTEEREVTRERWVKMYDEDGNPVYGYALRYEEFIGPIIATLQEHQTEVDDLKQQVADQNERIDRLERLLQSAGLLTT